MLPISLLYSATSLACNIDLYVDKSVSKAIVFNVISVDGKNQFTTSPVSPGHNTSAGYVIPCTAYNIYAQPVDTSARVNPYGDYAYIANPLQLTGDLSVFFPSRFKNNAADLNFPNQFKKSG